jgi:hypothetical protein
LTSTQPALSEFETGVPQGRPFFMKLLISTDLINPHQR